MTKSQNTKNEQQKDLCITSEQLTEQWKKGELNRNKIYYYETPFNTTDTASGFWLCNHLDVEKDKVEILREVPSYEEYERILVENDSLKQIRDELDCTVTQLREDKIDLEEENKQLKELLKECKVSVLNLLSRDVIECNGINQAELLVEIEEVQDE